MVGEAPVVYQGRHYTKYANGVAVVTMPAIVALAAGWGLAMPALMRLAERLDRAREAKLPAYVHEGWRQLDNHG